MNKIYSMLGLCARSRNLAGGEFAVLEAIKNGKAKLVIVAKNASDNTRKLFNDKCSFYEVPIRIFGTKEELGHCTGKEIRASLAVVDEGFAKGIIDKLDSGKADKTE